jgi:hypothetical protein
MEKNKLKAEGAILALKHALKTIFVHNEGDGGYCDTGADMDWACRSRCSENAADKLYKLIESYEKKYITKEHKC